MELMVSFGVVALLAGVVLARYRVLSTRFNIVNESHNTVQNLRTVQEHSISGKEIEGFLPDSFGLYLDSSNAGLYLLYADQNNNQRYDVGEEMREVELEKNFYFDLDGASEVDINFEGPSPVTTIWVDDSLKESTELYITSLKGSPPDQKIRVNKGGLIYTDER